MKVDEFLSSRENGIAHDKVVMLRFLERVSDSVDIESKTKGRSLVHAEFGCGAYKGSEVLTYSISKLNPMRVLYDLTRLTSGHKFSWDKAEQFCLSCMEERL